MSGRRKEEEHGRKLDRRNFGKTETPMKKLGCQMTHIKVDMSKEEEIDEKLIFLHFSEKRTVVIVIHEYKNRSENSKA